MPSKHRKTAARREDGCARLCFDESAEEGWCRGEEREVMKEDRGGPSVAERDELEVSFKGQNRFMRIILWT